MAKGAIEPNRYSQRLARTCLNSRSVVYNLRVSVPGDACHLQLGQQPSLAMTSFRFGVSASRRVSL